jgi:hypothetical protein
VLVEHHLITEVAFTVAEFEFIGLMDELVVLLELNVDKMAVEVEDCDGA